MKNGRTFARAGWAALGAVSLPLGLASCSVLGESERFASLPEACFAGISSAVDAAVGPLAPQGRKDDVLPEDTAISRPSGSTKFCARSFTDAVNRRDWKQGEPNFRKVFLEYALYRSGFLSEGVDDAKRELKPPLVDPKRLVPEPNIGDEAVGWWDYSQSQGASWQVSLRVSNMRVLVRVSGADYLSDYTVDRQFSARLDYDSQRLKDELRREAQSIAKAVVDQLAHPSSPGSP
ncbi:hypothetical protein Srot_0200 [Segniliparus rotundus DSM 44985]|uniref:Lipoprotein n=1 Tax=Segniliparus rotundus (strain ATCC BAA-972 / CDC 1076 / CIP 108378 / DSM 44985 / JCM 13578) TaxID=640132 RepID=D6ZAE7_SEGRD|nr:hypothetical protein [Segniliparus rotundus]ADG96689.1 hypothetical protein Srot_0200 [Segniliparus rotundus DSM 44985]